MCNVCALIKQLVHLMFVFVAPIFADDSFFGWWCAAKPLDGRFVVIHVKERDSTGRIYTHVSFRTYDAQHMNYELPVV